MMRRLMATLTLAAICGLLMLAGTRVGDLDGAFGVAADGPGVARASDAHVGGKHAGARTWRLTLSPAPDDLALAEISFHAATHSRLSARSLRAAVGGPFGDDYLATATPRFTTPGALRVLVLLVNRPSPLLDPVSVGVRVTASRAIGAPVLRSIADPFTRPATNRSPALCDLRTRGKALDGSELRPLGARGAALAGYGIASAVAQAYDVICGLPHASSFERAVQQSSSGSPVPAPTQPSPPSEAPGPTPTPPSPEPPHCTPCDPPPGYACPLTARASVCVAPATGGARRAPTDAH